MSILVTMVSFHQTPSAPERNNGFGPLGTSRNAARYARGVVDPQKTRQNLAQGEPACQRLGSITIMLLVIASGRLITTSLAAKNLLCLSRSKLRVHANNS